MIPEARTREGAASILAALVCLGGLAIYLSTTEVKYPYSDWLFLDLGKIWFYGLLLNAAYVGAGHLVLRRLLRLDSLPALTHLVLSAATGMVAFCLAMYVLGVLGLWTGWVVVVLALGFALGGGIPLLRHLGALGALKASSDEATTWIQARRWLLSAGGAWCIGLLYLGALTPDSINFDAAWYHLPIAEDYARAGRLVPFYGDHNKTFPHLKSMLDTWAFVVPGLTPPLRWMLALQNEFTVVLWTMVGVQAAAQWMLNDRRVPALWVAFFLFPCIFVYDHNIGGSSDHYLGFFALPIFLALGRLLERFDYRYAALLGLVSAGAVLTKFQAVYMVFAATVAIVLRALVLLRSRDEDIDLARILKAPLLVAGVGLLAASPHFVKNAVFHGNPMYPFLQDLVPSSHPIHDKSGYFFKHGYPNRPFLPHGTVLEKFTNAVRLFFTYSFEPHYTFTKGYPSGGSVFTILMPCVLLFKDKGRILLGISIGFLALFVWGNTYIGDRYLHGFLPVLIATGAALVVRVWEMGIWARVGLVPLLAFQVIWGADAAYYSKPKRIDASLTLLRSGFEDRRDDKSRYPYRLAQREMGERIPEDARVLAVNYRGLLGINREILSDVQAWQSVFFYEPLTSPRELWELYEGEGITHILSSLNQRPPETLQGMVLVGDLLTRHVTKKQRVKSVSIAEMPTQAPPAEADYQVTVIGAADYSDGLYAVQDLHVYPRLPKEMREKVEPRVRIKGKQKARKRKMRAAVQDSNAVVIATKKARRIDASVKSLLAKEFQIALRAKRYTVYVRRTGKTRPPSD